MLWQTHTITPAHEHFITVHIRQKILIHIERLQSLNPRPDGKTYVMFLPLNETHDIGLLFLNYELISKGYHTIFLGESVPMEDLQLLNNLYTDITYVSYFTIMPTQEKLSGYLDNLNRTLIENTKNSVLLLGKRFMDFNPKKLPKQMKIYNSIENLVKDL